MMIRSFLFVPADSEHKLAKAKSSPADALILDLEDAVAPDKRDGARGLAREFLISESQGPASLWVRINPVGSAEYEEDLDAVVAARPIGLVVPKPQSPDALHALDRDISALEDKHGLPAQGILVMPIVSETPWAVTTMFDYRDPPPRLAALTWGAEDLSAALGAVANRDESGELLFTYRMVRSRALIAARAAGVEPIDTLYPDFRDIDGLSRAAQAAQREGFTGMLAIHPDQIGIINAAFTPSAADVAHARRVVEAFAKGGGVVALDGKMLDQPHLKQAQHVLMFEEKIRTRRG
jgi:citrate lyase subunit beta/citryl-CoA lyase